MKRSNIVLAVLLIVQVAIVVWLFRPTQSGTASVQPLVKDVAADTVTAIKVQDNTNQVSLAKVDGKWVAPDAANYPAITANVTKLISDVVGIDTSRLVATTATSHGRLKVAPSDFIRRVELQTADGKQHVVFVGSSPNVNTTHVRVDGEDAVYLTSGVLAADARSDLGGWINTAYMQYSPESVTGLTVKNGAGNYTFAKAEDGAWNMAGLAASETLTPTAVSDLVNQVANVVMVKPLGKDAKPEYGLDQPQATATLNISPTTGAPFTVTLAVGAADNTANTYTVKSSASDYYATVGKYTLQGLVGATRGEFVAAAPAPAAAATITGTAALSDTAALSNTEAVTAEAPISGVVPLTQTAPVTRTTPLTP